MFLSFQFILNLIIVNRIKCINIQFKDGKQNKYTLYHNRKGDYCVLDEKGSIIKFELLNKWKSNTLNFRLDKLDEFKNKNKVKG